MKGIIAYDTVHGSTKAAAEAMAEQVKAEGHEVELISIKDGGAPPTTGDFMFLGSPTRGGKMTKGAKEFIDQMDVSYWSGRPVVLFDTIGPLSKDREKRDRFLGTIKSGSKTAAERMKEQCRGRGIMVHPKAYHLAVVGMWGPLAEDAPDMAKGYAHEFLAGLK